MLSWDLVTNPKSLEFLPNTQWHFSVSQQCLSHFHFQFHRQQFEHCAWCTCLPIYLFTTGTVVVILIFHNLFTLLFLNSQVSIVMSIISNMLDKMLHGISSGSLHFKFIFRGGLCFSTFEVNKARYQPIKHLNRCYRLAHFPPKLLVFKPARDGPVRGVYCNLSLTVGRCNQSYKS